MRVVTIPRWCDNWVMTRAQIELMTYDGVETFYKKDKKNKFGKVDEKKLQDVSNQWNEKYADKKQPIKLSDIMPSK